MAPEISTKKYKGSEVDLFAAAVALFIMVKQGPPFDKADPKRSRIYKFLSEGLYDNFWAPHEKGFKFSPEFKDLIQRMLALEPEKRLDLEQLREHPWMKEFTPELSAVQQEFKKIRDSIDAKIKEEESKIEELKELQKKKEEALANSQGTDIQGMYGGFKPYRGSTEEDVEWQLKNFDISFNEDAKRSIQNFEVNI